MKWSEGVSSAARDVCAREGDGPGLEARLGAAERAVDKLLGHLSGLVGAAGSSALLRRALVLTARAHPLAAPLGLDALERGQALGGLREVAPNGEPEAARAAALALLENLLGLFSSLVGEELMVQVVREVWPAVPAVPGKPGAEGPGER